MNRGVHWRVRPLIVTTLLLLLAGIGLPAGTITQVVIFGDSLSDNGNTYGLTGYPPSPPYYQGRHSNGPVAVEYMAGKLGVPLQDYAYDGLGNVNDGGTALVSNGLPGMTPVFDSFRDAVLGGTTPFDPNAQYLIWGSANDFSALTGPGDLPGIISTAVTNVETIAGTLIAFGAHNVMVVGLPDLSLTPRLQLVDSMSPGAAMLFHVGTGMYNQALVANLPPGVRFFDTNMIFLDIYNNPGKYGLTNVTSPCYDSFFGMPGTTVCANQGQYLFWDDIHPTTAAHEIMGNALANAAVPEPATVGIVAAGLVLVAVVRRQRRA